MASTSASSLSPSHRLSPNGVVTNGTHHQSDAVLPSSASSLQTGLSLSRDAPRPTVLYLGADICYHPEIYARLTTQFDFIQPPPEDRQRSNFIRHLKDRTWGNFSAIMKPFWSTGSEMHPWDRELISLLPDSVKVMAGAGAGFDWVDIAALSERGIVYANGAHASTESVTNTALYHLISVFTHATASSLAARSGSPTRFQHAHVQIPFESHNPQDHTLGIVGLGLIGSLIATKARCALGMNIIYHDIYRKSPEQERSLQVEYYPSLDDMLPHCDCILLATPGGKPILTRRTLALLKPGARVVNIARGSLIDEDDLADALASGHVAAAGLDVHAREPNVDSRFRDNDRVQLTCHTGGASVETNKGFERLVMENVEDVLIGRPGGARTGVNRREVEAEVQRRATDGVDGVDHRDGHAPPDQEARMAKKPREEASN